jgi:sugar phosphate isomerase/epimerase
MKTSISLFLSDILPHRKKLIHKVVKAKIFNNQTTDSVFSHLKGLGLDGFELLLPLYSLPTDEDILEVKYLSKKYAFPVLSVHQSIRLLGVTKIKEIERLFEIAHMLRAKVVVLHMNSAKRQIFDKRYIDALHTLEKKYKIKATFENMEKHIESYFHAHRWHDSKFPELVKEKDFHITFDIVHLAHSGGDILRFFEKNKERIVNVHLSDYRRHVLNASLRPMRFKHMPLGDGELPIEPFISLLQKEKYNGLLTLEVNTDIEGVRRCVSVMNQYTYAQKSN